MVIHLFQMMSILLQNCSGISCEFCIKIQLNLDAEGFLKIVITNWVQFSLALQFQARFVEWNWPTDRLRTPTLHYLPSKLLTALQLQEVPTCLSILDKGYNTWWCHLSFEFTQTKWCRPLPSKWYNLWLQTSPNVSHKEHSLAVWSFSR